MLERFRPVIIGLIGLLISANLMATEPPETVIRQLLRTSQDVNDLPVIHRSVADLIATGPDALPMILNSIPDSDVVKANWLRFAFTRIVDEAVRTQSALPTEMIITFAKDRTKPGRARRLALETAERLVPGTTAKLLSRSLDDPEFGADAIAVRIQNAQQIEKTDPMSAIRQYREAFDVVQDFNQCTQIATRLQALGVTVDAGQRLGTMKDWHIIGPFDDADEKGYANVFPPERAIELNASYSGKIDMIRWKRYQSDAPDGRVDLLKAVGPHDGAIAYAYVSVRSPRSQQVEIRASGDDNLAVWFNQKKVIDHGTYRSHFRIDWHRVKVTLKEGDNTLLVKVCQCPAPKEKMPGPPAKWEFHLRLVDIDGRGVSLPINTQHSQP